MALVRDVLKAASPHRWDPWDGWTYREGEPTEVEGLGTVEVIDVHELGEGDWGGSTHIIFKITDPDGNRRYFKKDGHYQSFNGADWEYGAFYEVNPVTKHVTAYDYTAYEEVS